MGSSPGSAHISPCGLGSSTLLITSPPCSQSSCILSRQGCQMLSSHHRRKTPCPASPSHRLPSAQLPSIFSCTLKPRSLAHRLLSSQSTESSASPGDFCSQVSGSSGD